MNTVNNNFVFIVLQYGVVLYIRQQMSTTSTVCLLYVACMFLFVYCLCSNLFLFHLLYHTRWMGVQLSSYQALSGVLNGYIHVCMYVCMYVYL